MGKSERNESKDMTRQNISQNNTNAGRINDVLYGSLPGQMKQADQTYGDASSAFKGMGGPTGAYDPETYGQVSGQIQKNIQTGGYNDPEQLASLKRNIASGQQFGGMTEEEYSKLNAGGLGGIDVGQAGKIRSGYEDLSKSGGISDATADAMRRQAASGTQSIYHTLGQNMQRKQAASGFGGGGGETAQLARQAAQESSKSITGVNAQVGQLRQQGIEAGLGGLSQFEQAAATGQRAVTGAAQQGRIQSTGQEADLAASQARGVISSTQAASELATNAAQQKIQAAGGLVNLYNSSPGYVTSLVKSILEAQQTQGTLNSQQAQIMEELSKQPGVFGTIMNTIGTIGGAAAGVMGGMGAVGLKAGRAPMPG